MNKTILITGSSSGIGKATAKFFHHQGWNVVATMRNPERQTELTSPDNVLVTRLDVRTWSGQRRRETFGSPPGSGSPSCPGP